MSSKKRIEITFDAEGNPSIEAFGYTGGECKLATKPFEDAAGTVVERKMKGVECSTIEVATHTKVGG
jgi:hypothetical protein